MPKRSNFFYSQLSTLPKEALAKFYLSTGFGLSFMISSVAPNPIVDFLRIINLIAKIANRNLNQATTLLSLIVKKDLCTTKDWLIFCTDKSVFLEAGNKSLKIQ